MCDDNVPYIVTMNFGFGKNGATSLYFHSSCEGKKINWKDGLAALWFIFRYRFFD